MEIQSDVEMVIRAVRIWSHLGKENREKRKWGTGDPKKATSQGCAESSKAGMGLRRRKEVWKKIRRIF